MDNLRFYVVCDVDEPVGGWLQADIETFARAAKKIGGIYELGDFIRSFNDDDCFASETFVRCAIVDENGKIIKEVK